MVDKEGGGVIWPGVVRISGFACRGKARARVWFVGAVLRSLGLGAFIFYLCSRVSVNTRQRLITVALQRSAVD